MQCYDAYKKYNVICNKSSCRYWITSEQNLCCTIIAADENEIMTLEEIGKALSISKMQTFLLQKQALKKAKQKIDI